ncbi:MAG: hypothetical protein Q7R83_01035, partial [bacterium]|nr:hypothetical protein [bacterium]
WVGFLNKRIFACGVNGSDFQLLWGRRFAVAPGTGEVVAVVQVFRSKPDGRSHKEAFVGGAELTISFLSTNKALVDGFRPEHGQDQVARRAMTAEDALRLIIEQECEADAPLTTALADLGKIVIGTNASIAIDQAVKASVQEVIQPIWHEHPLVRQAAIIEVITRFLPLRFLELFASRMNAEIPRSCAAFNESYDLVTFTKWPGKVGGEGKVLRITSNGGLAHATNVITQLVSESIANSEEAIQAALYIKALSDAFAVD